MVILLGVITNIRPTYQGQTHQLISPFQ